MLNKEDFLKWGIKLKEVKLEQTATEFGRFYVNAKYNLPSVTNINSKTKSKSSQVGLSIWRKRIGDVKADKITNDAASRGVVMHDALELYYDGNTVKDCISGAILKAQEKGTDKKLIVIGLKLFEVIINSGLLQSVDLSISREFTIYYTWVDSVFGEVGFAGQVDHLCLMFDGRVIVLDYKTSKSKKPIDWVEDYLCQVSAYVMGIESILGITNLKLQGEIWISCENGDLQKFVLSRANVEDYFEMFKCRVLEFYDLSKKTKNN